MSALFLSLFMAATSPFTQGQTPTPADAIQAADALNQALDSYNDSELNACTVETEQEPQESVTDFCTDPYWAVCQDYFINGDERTKRREALRKEARDYALTETRKVAGKSFKPVEPDGGIFRAEWNNVRHTLTYYDHLASYIAQRNLGVEISAVAAVTKDMQTLLQRAIDEQPLKRGQRKKLKTRVRDTAFVYKELIETLYPDSKRSSDAIEKLFKNYYELCGFDGMKDNAFQLRIKEKYHVVVCPGRVLAGTGGDKDPELNRLSLLHDMGHEMGHHFDWDEETGLYEKYFKCVSEHHSDSISESTNAVLAPFEEATKQAYGKEWFETVKRNAKTRKYLTEITADFWAVELIVQYLKSLPKEKLTYDYTLKVLRTSMSGLCDDKQGDTHTSGAFRIEVMARRHPYLHDLMGCSKAEYAHAKPGCTLSGPTRALY